MNCNKTRQRLSEYLDGVLPDGERAALDAHLAECPECRTELESLRRTVEAVAGLPVRSAPVGFKGRLMARLRAEAADTADRGDRVLTLWPRLAAVAAMFLVAAALTLAVTPGGLRSSARPDSPRLAMGPAEEKVVTDRDAAFRAEADEEGAPPLTKAAESIMSAPAKEISGAYGDQKTEALDVLHARLRVTAAGAGEYAERREYDVETVAEPEAEAEVPKPADESLGRPSRTAAAPAKGAAFFRNGGRGAMGKAGVADVALGLRPPGAPRSAGVQREVKAAQSDEAGPAERTLVMEVDKPLMPLAVATLELARNSGIEHAQLSAPAGRDEIEMALSVPADKYRDLLRQIEQLAPQRKKRSTARDVTDEGSQSVDEKLDAAEHRADAGVSEAEALPDAYRAERRRAGGERFGTGAPGPQRIRLVVRFVRVKRAPAD